MKSKEQVFRNLQWSTQSKQVLADHLHRKRAILTQKILTQLRLHCALEGRSRHQHELLSARQNNEQTSARLNQVSENAKSLESKKQQHQLEKRRFNEQQRSYQVQIEEHLKQLNQQALSIAGCERAIIQYKEQLKKSSAALEEAKAQQKTLENKLAEQEFLVQKERSNFIKCQRQLGENRISEQSARAERDRLRDLADQLKAALERNLRDRKRDKDVLERHVREKSQLRRMLDLAGTGGSPERQRSRSGVSSSRKESPFESRIQFNNQQWNLYGSQHSQSETANFEETERQIKLAEEILMVRKPMRPTSANSNGSFGSSMPTQQKSARRDSYDKDARKSNLIQTEERNRNQMGSTQKRDFVGRNLNVFSEFKPVAQPEYTAVRREQSPSTQYRLNPTIQERIKPLQQSGKIKSVSSRSFNACAIKPYKRPEDSNETVDSRGTELKNFGNLAKDLLLSSDAEQSLHPLKLLRPVPLAEIKQSSLESVDNESKCNVPMSSQESLSSIHAFAQKNHPFKK